MSQDNIQGYLDAGRLAEAAALLEGDHQYARALDLYEQLWDFKAATRCALALDDLPRALDAALQHRDPLPLEEILQAALKADRAVILTCAAKAEERGDGSTAVRLYQAAADHQQAARCLESLGLHFEAAQQYELCGQPQKALALYQQHVADLEPLAQRREPGESSPELLLGRLLLRYGREEEALPWLQRAWTPSSGNSLAGRAIVAGLARLGFERGARFILQQLEGNTGERPTLRQCLSDPELNPLEDEQSSGRKLAGRYQIGKLLGSGGMGRVHLGVDLLSKTEVAIKVFTGPGGVSGRDAYLRFLQEARTTGQLHHPHIVSLLDFNEGMRFMVLEYMVGGTLADRLSAGLGLTSCRAILLQVLSGLEAAHQRGIVHRDIKPSNIFFTRGGAAKLGDFGVAHLQDAGHTQTGAFIGTLAFMSPEQIPAGEISFATDIYALGVTLYLMVVGELPFQPPDLINQHLHAPPPRPSTVVGHLPSQLDEIVLRCMAKKPADRFESLTALRQAVEQLPTEDDLSVRPSSRGPAAAASPSRVPDQRYLAVSTLARRPDIHIQAVHDNQLGRSVIQIHLFPGPELQRSWAILAAAAAIGGVHLQRVLVLDRPAGKAILEQQLGDQFERPEDPLNALILAGQLGQALAPIHGAGFAHGGVAEDTVATIAGTATLSLYSALTSRQESTPAEDVAAVLSLTGISIPEEPEVDLTDGPALAQWVAQKIKDNHAQQADARRKSLWRSAPPHIRKMIGL